MGLLRDCGMLLCYRGYKVAANKERLDRSLNMLAAQE